MIDFKTGLQRYIEAEVERRVEERLAGILQELGIPLDARSRRAAGGAARAPKPAVTKARHAVSAETRAKMRAAWVRRKKAQQAAASVEKP